MVRVFYAFLWIVAIYMSIFIGHSGCNWFQKPRKSIDFFCWGDTIEAELLEEFEASHGIHVNIHPFSSNEEMVVKLKAVQGKGYDLVCASDYAVRILKEEGLIAPIQKDKIPNITTIDPYLMHQNFDPNNEVSLPVEWEPYVIVTKEAANLGIKDLFRDLGDDRLVMTSDPIEAIMYAAYSLYGKIDHLSDAQLQEVGKLLKKQKKHIEAYVDHRAKYLMETGNCDLALLRCGFARLMEQDGVPIHYALPKDWHFINIENLAITSSSQKTDEVHAFINFFLSKNSQKVHSENTLVYPVHKELITESELVKEIHQKNDPQFFHYIAKEEDTRDLWVSLKGHQP